MITVDVAEMGARCEVCTTSVRVRKFEIRYDRPDLAGGGTTFRICAQCAHWQLHHAADFAAHGVFNDRCVNCDAAYHGDLACDNANRERV